MNRSMPSTRVRALSMFAALILLPAQVSAEFRRIELRIAGMD